MTTEPVLRFYADLSELGKPPSSNHMYRKGPFGKRILTTAAEAYGNRVRDHLGKLLMRIPALDKNAPYRVHIRVWTPDLLTKGYPRKADSRFSKFDASNLRKLLEDVVAKVIGVDDSCTLDAYTSKRYADQERIVVEVWEYPLDEINATG